MSEKDLPENHPTDHGEVVQRARTRISMAWIFPVLAAAASAWLFWSHWKSNGPEVEILFDTAPGIQAGKTPLVYRGVTAGTVTSLRLDRELDKVVLVVRLKAFAAELAREGTLFWIDKLTVGIGETSGLEALIQGNSIEARMGDGPPATRFIGAAREPLIPLESPALILKLRAPNIPFLDRRSPLFFRGVAVGIVEDKTLDDEGHPYLRIVVEKEFAQLVRSNARFWPVAPTTVKIGPGGVKLDIMGLKAILLGGIAFDFFGDPGDAVNDNTEFTLYTDEVAARTTGVPVHISFLNGQGIQAGQTEMRYLGIPVGRVETVTLNEASKSVDTTVRFQPAFEHLHTAGSVFTLIRPQISLEGISGLETLVGGPYIDCVPGPAGKLAGNFEGRTSSDEGRMESDGLHFTLHAKTIPPLGKGAPVLYRGLLAGRVMGRSLDAKGQPYLDVVIRKTFAHLLPRNARFWRVPATSLQAGPGMLNLDIAGLQTLIQGAVAFDVFDAPEALAQNDSPFALFDTEFAARATSPPIRVTFENGQGLLAGHTQVRYLGQPVGLVETVTQKNGQIEAVLRLNTGYDFLRREGSAFSIVRLDVSLDGVSGLETLLSGVYIDCVPSGEGPLAESFSGVPLTTAIFEEEEETGLEVVVTASQTNISVDAPVTYRGLTVGKVARKVLSADGGKVGLCVVINPPYTSLIRENTQFWNAGGIKVSLGFFSIKVKSASLDALAHGELAFATPEEPEMGPAASRGHEFELNSAPRREWLRWAPPIPAKK